LQYISGNRLVPLTHPNRRIVQQANQSPRDTRRLGFPRYLKSDFAQVNRLAFVNTDEQPDKVAQARDVLTRTQLLNPVKPGMIQTVDRRRLPPRMGFGKPILSEFTCRSTPFL
jgi:hypothetical protein